MYVLEILFGGVIVVPLIKALGGIALLLLWMRLPLALETAFFLGVVCVGSTWIWQLFVSWKSCNWSH